MFDREYFHRSHRGASRYRNRANSFGFDRDFFLYHAEAREYLYARGRIISSELETAPAERGNSSKRVLIGNGMVTIKRISSVRTL